MKENNMEQKKAIKKPLIITILCAFAVMMIVGSLAALAISGDVVIKGVTVEDKPVSEMSEQELSKFIKTNISKEIPEGKTIIHFNGADYEINFSDVILGYDAEKTAKIAYGVGRDGNFFKNIGQRIGAMFKDKNVLMEPVINQDYIDAFSDEICKTVEPRKVDDYYFIDGDRLKLVFGNSGNFIDVDLFKSELLTFLRKGESGEITIEVIQAEPKQFNVNEIYENIASEPTNTYYEEIDGKKYVKSAKNGYSFDKTKLAEAIEKNKGINDSFYFELEVLKPEITELNETGLFADVLAKYTSKITDHDKNRLNNVHLAASKINGVIINPGDTFAYLSYVEPITVEGGYKTANVYANGKITQDIGGGVCQVSSALYSAVLYADLEVIKRYNHSLTVGYVPYGQDATVSSGEIDFRFINNTNEPVKIIASSDNNGVYITLKGKKLDPSMSVEIENVTTQVLVPETIVTEDAALEAGTEVVDYAGKTGYIVDTYKLYYKNGELVKKEHITTSRYKKIDKTVRKGPTAEQTVVPPVSDEGEGETDLPTENPVDQVPQTPAIAEPILPSVSPTESVQTGAQENI
mgnify:CR=1 FL=1